MTALTQKQRNELHRRLARAIAWDLATAYQKDQANHSATVVLDEIERVYAGAALGRRGVLAVVAKIEAAG